MILYGERHVLKPAALVMMHPPPPFRSHSRSLSGIPFSRTGCVFWHTFTHLHSSNIVESDSLAIMPCIAAIHLPASAVPWCDIGFGFQRHVSPSVLHDYTRRRHCSVADECSGCAAPISCQLQVKQQQQQLAYGWVV